MMPRAVTRLIFTSLPSASLEFVLAQRLVRKICSGCREEYEPKKDVLQKLGLSQMNWVIGNFSLRRMMNVIT